MPARDYEETLVINKEHYEVAFSRSWTRVNEEQAWQGERRYSVDDDRATDIYVNGIPIGYFLTTFADMVIDAVDKWLREHEPEVIDDRY